jgi:Cu(I)/Ag(I) efflux system membrane fusion protein
LAPGFWGKVWLVVKTVQARLRFLVILAAVGGLIASWDTLNAYWEKWTRPVAAAEAAGDTEYFCPMHPYIVRDNPKEKCPICHMDLARRKKGSDAAEPLPAGTVNRVQLTPYRVVLAGVQTSEAQLRPLVQTITAFGSVEFNETRQAHIAARQKGRIVKLHVNFTGQVVEKGDALATLDIRYSPELTSTLEDLLRAQQRGDQAAARMARKRLRLWDINDQQVEEFLRTGEVNTRLTITSPIHGHVIKKYLREGNFVDEGTPLYDVADLDTVWLEAQVYEADQALLREGMPVRATSQSLSNRVFEGTLDFVYPHLDESSRTLTVRFHLPNPDHQLRPGMYATVTIQVPANEVDLLARTVAESWARSHTTDLLAQALAAPASPTTAGVGPLLRVAERYAALQRGLVLAVPESAVIDTGRLKIVYRQASPDVYEGVLVELGPRMAEPGSPTAFYPVLRGLDSGDRVVTNGAFLVDAETRLNPAAGSIYFGGSGGKAGQAAVAVRPSTPADLGDEDRRLIEAQRVCPITGKALGSMGTPVKLKVQNQTVFLCCDGCKAKALADPSRTLRRIEELKAKGKGVAPKPPAQDQAPRTPDKDAEIKARLAQLPPVDRAVAEAQKLCPITAKPLGSMGVPVKVMIDGQPVFVCCAGCEDSAKENAAKTLAAVKKGKSPPTTESRRGD